MQILKNRGGLFSAVYRINDIGGIAGIAQNDFGEIQPVL